MIEVKHLTKQYGKQKAVSNLTFSIEKGKIYGFLGPNGAGKSTTMNILTGCLAATSGEVTIDGYDIFEEPKECKKRIGYLPEIPPLYPDQTPREYLRFVAEAKGIPAGQRSQEIEEVLAQTQTLDVADRLIRNLSKGYRQRVGFAQAILGNPPVIILDEPTAGLDPKQIVEIRRLILELGKNHTVILSSHILSEIQEVCQTVMILSKGKLAACDTVENLTRRVAGSSIIELVTEAGKYEISKILADVEGIVQIKISELGKGRCKIIIHTRRNQSEMICRSIFFACSSANCAILEMHTNSPDLEDIYMELTSDSEKGV